MAKNPIAPDRGEEDDERISRKPVDYSSAANQQDANVTGEKSPDTSTYLSMRERGEERDESRFRGVQAMSEEEMEAFFQTEFLHSVLPQCPKIPGYHTCWLSTTNQYDTIPARMRWGYVPVTAEDIPNGYKISNIKTGEYSGLLGVNEMVLFKIPETAYQKIMKIMHHDRPNGEEDRLRAQLELLEGGDLSKGQPLLRDIGDGTEELLKRNSARSPDRFE